MASGPGGSKPAEVKPHTMLSGFKTKVPQSLRKRPLCMRERLRPFCQHSPHPVSAEAVTAEGICKREIERSPWETASRREAKEANIEV